jgi:acyl carrier protein
MPQIDTILSTLKSIITERFGIDTSDFTEQTRLGDIGLDSMHIVDIMLDVESQFDLKITNLALHPNPSLGEVCAEISNAG